MMWDREGEGGRRGLIHTEVSPHAHGRVDGGGSGSLVGDMLSFLGIVEKFRCRWALMILLLLWGMVDVRRLM